MSQDSPPLSPRPALEPKFSSIGDGRPESSTNSSRRSWHQPHEDKQGEQQDGVVNAPSRRVVSDSNGHVKGFRDKILHPRDSGGFLLDSSIGTTKRKRIIDKTAKLVRKKKPYNFTQEDVDNSITSVDGASASATSALVERQDDSDVIAENGERAIDLGTDQSQLLGDVKGKSRLSSQASPQSSNRASGSAYLSPDTQAGSNDTGSQVEQTTGIDPAQIVHMALSLNESRRASLSPGLLASYPPPGGRRMTSAGPSPLIGSTQGGAMRQALQQSRRASRRESPSAQLTNRNGSRSARSSPSLSRQRDRSSPALWDQDYEYNFSPATIMRAEKARAYLELSFEYKRLLQFLPPLKPSSNHAKIASSNSAPDSPAGVSTELGRPYNPLQYIRNKKVRARERDTLDGEAAGWNDVEGVRSWVDAVEEESQHPGYKIDDVAILPDWNEPTQKTTTEDGSPFSPSESLGSGAAASKLKRTKIDWSTNPADLLADVYWTEQGDHKALLEAKDGTRLFKKFQRPNSTGRNQSTGGDALDRPWTSNPISPTSDDYDQNRTSTDGSLGGADTPDVSPPQPTARGFKASGTARKVKRRLLRRKRKPSTDDSQFPTFGQDHDGPQRIRQRQKTENTGPLEKHMKKILADESRLGSSSYIEPTPPAPDDAHGRRGGVSEEHKNDSGSRRMSEADRSSENRSTTSLDQDYLPTPRISVEYVDDGDEAAANELFPRPSTSSTMDSLEEKGAVKPVPKGFGFLRRNRTKEQNQIAETDFASSGSGQLAAPEGSLARSSEESVGRSTSHTGLKGLPSFRKKSQEQAEDEPSNSAPTSKRFFKGGRIGEIVRNERSPGSEIVWKRPAPRLDSNPSSRGDLPDEPPDDDGQVKQRGRSHSRSRSDGQKPKYYMENLPSFVSSNAPKAKGEGKAVYSSDGDHISRQRRAREAEKRRSRFERLRPPGLSSPDISPSNSATDLSRYGTQTSSIQQQGRGRRGSDKSPNASPSPSRSTSAVRAADKRLNAVLREPGGVGRGGLPVTGLARVDARRPSSQPGLGHSSWSLALGSKSQERHSTSLVTLRDLAQVRALLIASGVKAKGIVSRANEPPMKTPTFMKEIASVSDEPVPTSISRAQMHVVAARMLSRSLEASVSSFEDATERFRGKASNQLLRRIEDLREKITADLSTHVRSSGDDADGFVARLTTTHTLAVKQVNDAVTSMMRSRKRRLKYLRRSGFAMLEWLVIGIMWFIWLFVFFLRLLRGFVMGTFRGVRWLLWL